MRTEIFIQGKTKNPAIQKTALARWRIVCVLNNGTVETRDGCVALNNATTKRAVLTALRDVLMRFNKAAVLKIYVSDDFVRNSLINGWLFRWKNNNWHKIRLCGQLVHSDLWQQISMQLSNHAVTFAKGEELNNENLKELEGRLKNVG